VHGNEFVGISLYHPARGGFHITWSRRQWSEDRNTLSYYRDPERPATMVYRNQSNRWTANPQGGANGRQPTSPVTNQTSATAASRRSP
jgi:hypothetical protein